MELKELVEIVASLAELFWQFLNSDFFIESLSTFCGAIIAFVFGLKLYKIQKKLENKTTLHFFISALTSLSNELYAFKGQIVQDRYKESGKCKAILEKQSQQHMKIEHMSKYIYAGEFEWPITQEKLEFLAMPDPNVIILLGVLRGSIKYLNAMVVNLNEDVKRFTRGDKEPAPSDIIMMIRGNELLYEQLDSTLYLTNLLIRVLIRFGKIVFGKQMKIESCHVSHEKYKTIHPEPIKSWEEYEWFPKKKKSILKSIKNLWQK